MTPNASIAHRSMPWQAQVAFNAARSASKENAYPCDPGFAASMPARVKSARSASAPKVMALSASAVPLSMESMFVRDLLQHRRVFAEMTALRTAICDAAVVMADAVHRGGRLLFVGDQGAAASAHHLATWFADRLHTQRKSAVTLSLGAHGPAMAAWAGPLDHPEGLSRLLAAYGRVGDCLVALSINGQSSNIVRALSTARSMGITSVGLLGHDGGRAKLLADLAVVVPSTAETLIQETQLFIGHSWCSQVQGALAPLD